MINQRRRLLISVTCFLACVAALVPFWAVTTPPLQDYPSHLARMHILANLEYSPSLQRFYEIHWEWLPNLAMDAVVPPLSRLIPLNDAGKVFVSASVLMWIVGPLALHHALFGRVNFWPLIGSFFAYNWCLSLGMLNFVFGSGLLFFALAAWVSSKNWRAVWQLLLFSIFASLLFFSHFIAFGIYVLAVLGFEAGRTYQNKEFLMSDQMLRHWFLVLGQFIVPAVLFIFFSPTKDLMIPKESIDWGGLLGRFNAARSPVLFEWGPIDYLALFTTTAVFVYAALTRSLRVHPAFVWILVLLSLVAVLVPAGLDGRGLRHIRVPPVLAALFFAGTTWIEKPGRKAGPVIFALCATLFLARTVITADRWQLYDARLTEFRQAVAKIEEGSSLFYVLGGDKRPDYWRTNINSVYPFRHVVDYITIDRSAFSPGVFADPGIQPIRPKAPYVTVRHEWRHGPRPRADTLGIRLLSATDSRPLSVRGDELTNRELQETWLRNFDYVAVLNLEQKELVPPDFLTICQTGSYFTIFKIEKTKIGSTNMSSTATTLE